MSKEAELKKIKLAIINHQAMIKSRKESIELSERVIEELQNQYNSIQRND